jgi:thioesterase domain-containing protein
MPVLIENVHYVRLRKHATHASRVSKREHAIARFEEQLASTKANLRVFETYATNDDPKREAVEAEVKALEQGLERLKASREDTLRERYRHERVLPYVYLLSGEIVRPYIRDVGLLVAGPKLKIAWADNIRRKRSDKIKLEPLLTVGPLEVYSETQWRQASSKGNVAASRG